MYIYYTVGDWYSQRYRTYNEISVILHCNESRSIYLLLCGRVFEEQGNFQIKNTSIDHGMSLLNDALFRAMLSEWQHTVRHGMH